MQLKQKLMIRNFHIRTPSRRYSCLRAWFYWICLTKKKKRKEHCHLIDPKFPTSDSNYTRLLFWLNFFSPIWIWLLVPSNTAKIYILTCPTVAGCIWHAIVRDQISEYNFKQSSSSNPESIAESQLEKRKEKKRISLVSSICCWSSLKKQNKKI